jgi:chondroitin AC lyase
MRKILFLLLMASCCHTLVAQYQPPDAFDADLDMIRQRIIDDLLQGNSSPEEIKKLTGSLKADGSWPGIDYKDVSRTGFEHRIHLENMVTLSRAVRKNKDAEAKKAVSAALDFWIKNDFICQNWWWNEMGTPNLMINTLLLLDTELTDQQRIAGLKIARRANLEAWGARPSGDRIQIAGMLGKQALFMRQADTLMRVMNEMVKDIKISKGVVGLQPDLSFHHRTDGVISTLSYGTGYAGAFAYWAAKTKGTKYALPQDALKLLTDYYLDGICASLAFGKYPDPGAKNRDISRRNTMAAVGPGLAENLLEASGYRAKELQQIINNRKNATVTSGSRAHFFWHSEYYTHQRPGYFASVRMHSSRGNNMEQPHNEEGLKNHHYGDGSTWITITGKEYDDIFPAFDFQKIPGTTIVQQPALPHWNELAKKGLTDFVGGITDGKYGAAATDFACVHDPLKARKAYFFFDKEFVCLGSAIQSKAEYPVVTTLNQCLLNGEVIVKSKNGWHKPAKGKHSLNDVSWVWHNDVGYIFPEPVNLNCNNTAATGSWRSINHQAWATDELVQKDIFCLWLDHGPRPARASYAYIVAPGMNEKSLAAYSKKTQIEIVSNTAAVQAVRNNSLGITQAVFYEPGEIKISKTLSLYVAQPCIIMVDMKSLRDGAVKVTVSDPTRKLEAINLEFKSKNKPLAAYIPLPKDGYAGSSAIWPDRR